MTQRKESLSIGRGGWVRWAAVDSDYEVFVHFGFGLDGRLVPIDLVVSSNDVTAPVLDTDALRRLPLSRIEAWANGPDVSESIRESADEKRADPIRRELVRLAPLRGAYKTVRPPRSLRLDVPKSRPFGRDFYVRVAALYTALVESGTRGPAGLIADANHVEVTQVHRWIREARRLEILGAARKGRAG